MIRQRNAEFYAAYGHFLEREEDSFSTREVAPPRVVIEGGSIDAGTFYGDSAPAHVRNGRALVNRTQVLRLSDRILLPDQGAFYALTPDNDLIRRDKLNDVSLLAAALPDRVETGCVGCTRSEENYYHWLIESVPRTMRVLADFPAEPALVNRPWRRYQKDFAALDGIAGRLRPLETVLFLHTAIVPTLSTRFAPMEFLGVDTLPSEDVLALPRLLQPRLTGRPRRLYVSRGDAGSRAIADEPALRRELEARGFDCVELSRLSLPQQAALFAHAEIVVAPHGAGLANMIFRCDRPCTIVELIPLPRWLKGEVNCFYNLSALCGFDHYLFDCAYDDPQTHPMWQPWRTDQAALLAFLDRLLQ